MGVFVSFKNNFVRFFYNFNVYLLKGQNFISLFIVAVIVAFIILLRFMPEFSKIYVYIISLFFIVLLLFTMSTYIRYRIKEHLKVKKEETLA